MKTKSLIKPKSFDLELVITFLLLLYYVGTFDIKNPIGNIPSVDYSPQRSLIEQVIAPLSYILVPWLISRKWKLCLYLVTRDLPLFCLLVLANLSIIWSGFALDSNISNIRGLLLSTMFGVYLAASFSIKEQTRMLAGVFGIVVPLSIFVALFVPGYGVHGGHLSGWTGIFEHKNTLGAHMAWSASILLSLGLSIQRNNLVRIFLWVGFALSSLLVFLAGSAGGIVNLVCVIAIVPLSKFFRKTYYKLQVVLTVGLTLLTVGLFYLLAANLETVAGLLGKDLTFSGRLPMWSELFGRYVVQKPLFGYGLNGFWETEYGQFFRARWVWEEVPHSHNGFVELILAVGLIGFSLFLVSFILLSIGAYHQAYTAEVLEDILPLQFVVTFLLANLSESRLLISNNIYWIFYVAVSMSLILVRVRDRKLKQLDKSARKTRKYPKKAVEAK